MLQTRMHPTHLYKVKAHFNIIGNEIVDALSKRGNQKAHIPLTKLHEFAHSTPFYLHKDDSKSMYITPYKGSIRYFQRYLHKYTIDNHLIELARNFPNTHKWTSDTNIDKIFSNEFWTNPHISENQIKQSINFRTNQYMGNARKHLL